MIALLGAIASAALFGVAASLRWPSHVAALFALAPWLAGIDRVRPRVAVLSAALLAVAVLAAAFWWLPAAIAAYAHVSALLAWVTALALAPFVLQPQFIVACGARLIARRAGATRAIAGAVTVLAYVGTEWALPKPLADTLGIGLFPSVWLRQGAELAGPRALTLLCLFVSECTAAAAAAPALAAATLVFAALVYGGVRARAVDAAVARAPTFSAGVVQAAITAYDKLAAEQGTYETVRQILDTHIAMSDELLRTGRVDLLIWPETVYPTTFGAPKSEEGAEFDREITAVPRRTGVPLVFGAFENGGMSGEHNAAFFLDGHGDVQIYRKSLLFPLTEYVPAWLDAGTFRAALPWTGRWSPGSGPSTVVERIAGLPVRFEPLICYEAIHLQYVARAARAGPDVLLTLSNDAWFDGDAGPRLHLAAAALASVETRLPQIRATNSGISALILPTGEIVSPTPFGNRASLRISVPSVARQWTPAVAWGDWLGRAACFGCIACVLLLVALRGSARPVRSMT